jgi:hypothetical protein
VKKKGDWEVKENNKTKQVVGKTEQTEMLRYQKQKIKQRNIKKFKKKSRNLHTNTANRAIVFLNHIRRPVLYLKRHFRDCILSPSSGKNLSPEIRTSFIDWAILTRFLPEDGDRIQSPKVVSFKYKTGRWIMSKYTIIVLIIVTKF